MTRTTPHPTCTPTPTPISDSTPPSAPITASAGVPASAFVAHQHLFLILFICLSNKGLLSFEEAAQWLEDSIDALSDLPQRAQDFLRVTLNALWHLHKETSPEPVSIQ